MVSFEGDLRLLRFFLIKTAFDSWSAPGKVAPEMSRHVSGSEEIHFKARMDKYAYI